MELKKNKIKRLLSLYEEFGQIGTNVSVFADNYEIYKQDSIWDKTHLHNLKNKIWNLSWENRSLVEHIYSLKLAQAEEEFIEEKRERSRLLDKRVNELNDEKENVIKKIQEEEKYYETWRSKIKDLVKRENELKEEIRPILSSLERDDIAEFPFGLQHWYWTLLTSEVD